MLVDHVLQLHDGLGLLTQLEKGISLLQERRGGLVALGPLLEEPVEVGDRLGVLLLGVVRLPDPVLGIVGEIGRGIGLKVFLEALDGERVAPLRVVRIGGVVELRGTRGRPDDRVRGRRPSRVRGGLADPRRRRVRTGSRRAESPEAARRCLRACAAGRPESPRSAGRAGTGAGWCPRAWPGAARSPWRARRASRPCPRWTSGAAGSARRRSSSAGRPPPCWTTCARGPGSASRCRSSDGGAPRCRRRRRSPHGAENGCQEHAGRDLEAATRDHGYLLCGDHEVRRAGSAGSNPRWRPCRTDAPCRTRRSGRGTTSTPSESR